MTTATSFWQIGCASAQLKNDTFSTEISGQKLVMFRDSSGDPHVLQDRCCHRGFPLSKGRVVGDAIQCGFHGWEFSGRGDCVKIPSQSADKPIAKSYCVSSYSCREQDGYIWVWMGDEHARTSVPHIPEFHSGQWIQGSSLVQCNFLRALEITFDGAHVYFVHATHPATVAAARTGFAERRSEVRVTDQGCIAMVAQTVPESEPIPMDVTWMEFSLPGRIRFYVPTPEFTYHMYFFVTPCDERSCRIDWLITNTAPGAEKLMWVPHSDFLQEDVNILEAVEKAYQTEGENFERSVEADIAPLMVRKIVKMAASGKWQGRASDIPLRQTFAQMGPQSYV